jgi:ATP-dependent protease ClpP protease subunit
MVDAPNASQAEQQKPNTTYVSFSAEINTNTTESLIATLSNLANQKISTVHLLISTPGGGVTQGINLYNVMRALPFKLITHNVGNVDSIGNAVFLAGVERYACPHSTFMFHGVGFDITTAMRLEEKTLKEKLDLVNIEHNRIGSIIEERTKLDKESIAKLFLEAQTKDAAYAIGCGIIHQVRDVEIPPGCPIVSLVFKR